MINSVQNSQYLPVAMPINSDNAQAQTVTANNQTQQFSSQASRACYAYGVAQINKEDVTKYSFQEHLAKLNAQGMIAGRDYEIKHFNVSNRNTITCKNKLGQEISILTYNKQGKCESSIFNQYKNGRVMKSVSKMGQKLATVTNVYYNDEVPQETFTPMGLKYNTSYKDYIKYLEENNIDYKLKYDEDDINSHYIEEFDKNGNNIKNTRFGENGISISDYNENGEEFRYTYLDKDTTSVSNYNHLWSENKLKNSDVDVSKLTEAGITYNTTPGEYIAYLKDNNIPFSINDKYDYTIEELDDDGEIKKVTSWFNDEKNPNTLSSVVHTVYNGDDSKTYAFDSDYVNITNTRFV